MATYFFFRIREELSDILFRGTDILVEYFGSIDDLRLSCIEHLTNLPRQKSFSRSRGTVEQNTFDVLDTELLNKSWGEDTRGEGATEDGAEFRVKASNTHILKLEIRSQDGIWGCSKGEVMTPH